jgi:hypothetical protein
MPLIRPAAMARRGFRRMLRPNLMRNFRRGRR